MKRPTGAELRSSPLGEPKRRNFSNHLRRLFNHRFVELQFEIKHFHNQTPESLPAGLGRNVDFRLTG